MPRDGAIVFGDLITKLGMLKQSGGTMLQAIRLIHTVFWALFAGSIIALPVVAGVGRFGWVLALSGLVTMRLWCCLQTVDARSRILQQNTPVTVETILTFFYRLGWPAITSSFLVLCS